MTVELFDASYYAYANPDLAAAGVDSEAELRAHFQEYGLKENRPFSPFVDLPYYRNLYPDLAAAGLTEQAQLLEHLQTYGVAENRRFSPLVDLDFYRNSYSDLQNFSSEQLFEHLRDFGLQEGRRFSPVADLNLYLSSYPDLQQAFGNDREKLLQHLEIYGISEGRTFVSGLNLRNYLNLNPDVSAAVGGSLEGALDHLVRYGINEKRPGVPQRLAAGSLQSQNTLFLVASNTDPNTFFGSDETDAFAAFDAQGNFLGFFNRYAGTDNPQNGIGGVTLGPTGNILASSQNSSQVLMYDPLSGEYLGVFGDASAEGSGLDFPAGITAGPDRNVYVSSLGTERILKFDGLTGQSLGVFARGNTDDTVAERFTDLEFGPDGNLYAGFNPPFGDPGLGKAQVRVYSGATGQLVRTITGLDFAAALAFGPDGNLYVSDDPSAVFRSPTEIVPVDPQKSGRIAVYSTLGNPLRSFNVGAGNAGNVSFSPDGTLYLSNPGAGTVTRYSPDTGAPLGDPIDVPAITGGQGRPTGVLFLESELQSPILP
ncbi:MAG: SMP-30/gluconolactonase/LRE family protein [Oscillatoria princeps RMCB-10]|nr:SMP-30/gluconolactonase/LRE family protein [Oscillatoria princeps RMCB-10]